MQQFSSIYLVILFVVALSAFSEAKRKYYNNILPFY